MKDFGVNMTTQATRTSGGTKKNNYGVIERRPFHFSMIRDAVDAVAIPKQTMKVG